MLTCDFWAIENTVERNVHIEYQIKIGWMIVP